MAVRSDLPARLGDMYLYFYDRQDRIAGRLLKKIERLDRRLKVLEERGRE